ncbi:hypothetical protein HN652_00935 [archaeon]|jgi:hypothetical protein|nr:hypothetical protein [archaeon]MBT6868944.1 hypothetical protein [archaeon]MBT7507556.1 hypothetical protein [archaeon]
MSSIEDIFEGLDLSKLDLPSLGFSDQEPHELIKHRILVETIKETISMQDETIKETISMQDETIKSVYMDDFDVTSADDEKPYIGTTSLASCAGIAIYDPKNKIGGVAHVFFNDKISMSHYMRDAQGRDIPSSGRSIVVDNPRPFDPFTYLAEALVRKADSIGGEKYQFMAFNVKHGCRTQEQNIQLQSVVERTVQKLTETDKITDFEYRNETQFKLDTRTGLIIPYY